MLINLRNALMTGKRKPTAKDYVQDGLVAMWDGIENAGWGTHDASATTWNDLSGNGHNISVSASVWNDGIGYDISKTSTFEWPDKLSNATVEVVGNITTLANDRSGIFFALNASHIAFGRYNTKGIFSMGATVSGYGSIQFLLPSPYPKSMSVSFFSNWKSALFDGVAPTNTTEGWNNVPGSRIGSTYDVGLIYCIRVYNRVLTDNKKLANYAIDKARFNLP